MPKIDEKGEPKHIHSWVSKDEVESYCRNNYRGFPCQVIKVGTEEFERRVAEYDNYLQMIRTTPSFRDWQEMKIAFKQEPKDMKKITEIRERINKRMKVIGTNKWGEKAYEYDKAAYLSKPDFPDPWTPFLYVVEGI